METRQTTVIAVGLGDDGRMEEVSWYGDVGAGAHASPMVLQVNVPVTVVRLHWGGEVVHRACWQRVRQAAVRAWKGWVAYKTWEASREAPAPLYVVNDHAVFSICGDGSLTHIGGETELPSGSTLLATRRGNYYSQVAIQRADAWKSGVGRYEVHGCTGGQCWHVYTWTAEEALNIATAAAEKAADRREYASFGAGGEDGR